MTRALLHNQFARNRHPQLSPLFVTLIRHFLPKRIVQGPYYSADPVRLSDGISASPEISKSSRQIELRFKLRQGPATDSQKLNPFRNQRSTGGSDYTSHPYLVTLNRHLYLLT